MRSTHPDKILQSFNLKVVQVQNSFLKNRPKFEEYPNFVGQPGPTRPTPLVFPTTPRCGGAGAGAEAQGVRLQATDG